MKDVLIRIACLNDAPEIANVHINSWREAYKSLLPKEFLDDRPLYFKNRLELWKKVTQKTDHFTFVAESKEHGIIGFINGSLGRDRGLHNLCEVRCLYVLEKYHKQKIGYNLLKAFFSSYQSKGHTKAYLWVLESNPTIKFYEATGGRFENREKFIDLCGEKYKELMYVWDLL